MLGQDIAAPPSVGAETSARLAELQEESERLKRRIASAVAADLRAARELDRALAAGKAATLEKNRAERMLIEASDAARYFNDRLRVEAKSNSKLSAMQRSAWPRVNEIGPFPSLAARSLRISLIELRPGLPVGGAGSHVHALQHSAEAIARTSYGPYNPPAGEQ